MLTTDPSGSRNTKSSEKWTSWFQKSRFFWSGNGKIIPWFGLVADIDGHYGSRTYGVCGLTCSGVSLNVHSDNFLFGPRVSVSVSRFRPFAEFLVGASHVSRGSPASDSYTSFANAVGGGLDYRVWGPLSVRGQLDWIETRFYGDTQNGVRFNTGISLHF